ncbi:MAG TPA: hypothetical protein VK770_02210 [Candidatus Acidoferrum sp.]|nr:hypothetical protein [Candidatus Acidoferrum sp.]
MKPGNANLLIGGLHDAIQENGVPGRDARRASIGSYLTPPLTILLWEAA